MGMFSINIQQASFFLNHDTLQTLASYYIIFFFSCLSHQHAPSQNLRVLTCEGTLAP